MHIYTAYQSCYSSTNIKDTGDHNNKLAIYGADAASFSGSLETADKFYYISGYHGLASVGSILSHEIFRCHGESSCVDNTNVKIFDSVRCYGAQSCENSNFEHNQCCSTSSGSFINGETRFGLRNANISHNSTDGDTLDLRGPFSGYNLTLASVGTTTNGGVTLRCYDLGCYYDNTITLINNNPSKTIYINCEYSIELDICNGSDHSYTFQDLDNTMQDIGGANQTIDTFFNFELSDYNTTVASDCNNQTNGANINFCVNATQCSAISGGITNTNQNGNICCLGYRSCYNTPLSTLHGKVRCDGYESCATISMINVTNNDLYCTANYACQDSNVTLNNNSIYCTGYQSCYGMYITDANIVNAAGYDVFQDTYLTGVKEIRISSRVGSGTFRNISKIVSLGGSISGTFNDIGDIYIAGYVGLGGSTVNMVNTVNLVGTSVGSSAAITNAKKVSGIGYESLHNTKLRNIKTVQGKGSSRVFRSANITNITTVYAQDTCDYCFMDATLTDVTNITVNGTGALTRTIIHAAQGGTYINVAGEQIFWSTQINSTNGNLTMVIEDYKDSPSNSATAIIHCNAGHYCEFDCKTENACIKIDLYCQGTCHLTCNNRTILCPNILQGNIVTDTAAPTSSPTIAPSAAPSQMPSQPTYEPVLAPTEMPVPNMATKFSFNMIIMHSAIVYWCYTIAIIAITF